MPLERGNLEPEEEGSGLGPSAARWLSAGAATAEGHSLLGEACAMFTESCSLKTLLKVNLLPRGILFQIITR